MRSLLCALVLSVSLPLTLAHAQGPGGLGGGPGMMLYDAMQKAAAGSWAEYTMNMPGRAEKIKMKYAVVEKSAKQMAMEIETQTPMGPVLMHMEFGPDGQGWSMVRSKMQIGSRPPREMPKQPGAQPSVKKGADMGQLVGPEEVSTPAGAFACKHYKQTGERGTVEVWYSEKAPPIGLVKMVDSRGAQITMSAQGTGATAKLK